MVAIRMVLAVNGSEVCTERADSQKRGGSHTGYATRHRARGHTQTGRWSTDHSQAVDDCCRLASLASLLAWEGVSGCGVGGRAAAPAPAFVDSGLALAVAT